MVRVPADVAPRAPLHAVLPQPLGGLTVSARSPLSPVPCQREPPLGMAVCCPPAVPAQNGGHAAHAHPTGPGAGAHQRLQPQQGHSGGHQHPRAVTAPPPPSQALPAALGILLPCPKSALVLLLSLFPSPAPSPSASHPHLCPCLHSCPDPHSCPHSHPHSRLLLGLISISVPIPTLIPPSQAPFTSLSIPSPVSVPAPISSPCPPHPHPCLAHPCLSSPSLPHCCPCRCPRCHPGATQGCLPGTPADLQAGHRGDRPARAQLQRGCDSGGAAVTPSPRHHPVSGAGLSGGCWWHQATPRCHPSPQGAAAGRDGA